MTARGLFCMLPTEATVIWEASLVAHIANRFGVMLSHVNYLTTTASPGLMVRGAVTVDCAH
eukprot:5435875-Pyramimonas_sp.AAC.1